MSIDDTQISGNQATLFATWLLRLMGGPDYSKTMGTCIECTLQFATSSNRDRGVFAEFFEKCRENGKDFCHKHGIHEENSALVGFNLFLKEKLYFLWIPLEKLPSLQPHPESWQSQCGLLNIPECSPDTLIAMVEEATGEKADLIKELRSEVDKELHHRWVCRSKNTFKRVLNNCETPSKELLDDLEKLIHLWRTGQIT